MKYKEFELQKQVVKYLRCYYPKVKFMSDTIANVKLSIPQKVRNKSIQCDGFHCPDLIIFEPNKEYNGLFIELKKETPFKKDGTLKKNEHLENQAQTILDLRNKGYYACFCWSFNQCKEVIDDYMKNI